jgi:hypothetical protein
MKAALVVIAAGLVFASGCAQREDWIDRTLVTVDVTGSWHGQTKSASGGMAGTNEIWLDLQQAGAKVTGFVRLKPDQSASLSGPIERSVSGDALRFSSTRGTVTGELTVNGDEMTGTWSTLTTNPITLRRVDPSSSR